ncbi:hypothetical protein ACRAWG_31415 [Methylobacterium sp. P31]
MKAAGLVHLARAGLAALLTKGADWLVRAARRVEPSATGTPAPETGRPAPTDGVGIRPRT